MRSLYREVYPGEVRYELAVLSPINPSHFRACHRFVFVKGDGWYRQKSRAGIHIKYRATSKEVVRVMRNWKPEYRQTTRDARLIFDTRGNFKLGKREKRVPTGLTGPISNQDVKILYAAMSILVRGCTAAERQLSEKELDRAGELFHELEQYLDEVKANV